jgi:serine/threonine protein kinase
MSDDRKIELGSEFAEYVITDLVARGGMGTVFRGQHRLMKRAVAIKVLPPEYHGREMFAQFKREVEVAGLLSHPSIAKAFDAGSFNGQQYLVTEFISGRNLNEIVRSNGPMTLQDAADCIRQAAAGLAYSHRQGVVHRDIKPSNLMRTVDGAIKIIDFGLARFCQGLSQIDDSFLDEIRPARVIGIIHGKPDHSDDASVCLILTPPSNPNPDTSERPLRSPTHGSIVGTTAFIPPEQTLSSNVDLRADIYSLGCTFYFLLTGKLVFPATGYEEFVHAHRYLEPPSLGEHRSDVPLALDAIFKRMVAKRVPDRYQSMTDVIGDLDAALAAHAAAPLIFISYRRNDSIDATHRLCEALAGRFGKESVCMDIDSVPPGVDFRRYIQEAVIRADVMLVIIGDHWVEALNARKERRLHDPDDYVRLEIESALRFQKPLVPVLVGRAPMPRPEELPQSLEALCYRNAAELRSGREYSRLSERLAQRIEDVVILERKAQKRL